MVDVRDDSERARAFARDGQVRLRRPLRGEDLTIGHPRGRAGFVARVRKTRRREFRRRFAGGARGGAREPVTPRRRPRPAVGAPGGRRGNDADRVTSDARPPPRAPAAPREREAQRARARAPARGSGRHARKRRPRPTAARSRSAWDVVASHRESCRKFPRTVPSEGTRHARRGHVGAFCSCSVKDTRAPPEVLDAPTRWPRSRRRAASTRPRAPPRGDASRGVRDRLHPSSSGRHESTVVTRTVGPPSRSRRARARRRRRARIPAWRTRRSLRRTSRPRGTQVHARDAGPRVSGS